MSDYAKDMPVIATDKRRGRLHLCPICGVNRWSCWGQARRHWEKCSRGWRRVCLRAEAGPIEGESEEQVRG